MEPDSYTYETTRRLLDTGYLLGLFVSKGIEASPMEDPDTGEVKIVLSVPAPQYRGATKKAISIKVL